MIFLGKQVKQFNTKEYCIRRLNGLLVGGDQLVCWWLVTSKFSIDQTPLYLTHHLLTNQYDSLWLLLSNYSALAFDLYPSHPLITYMLIPLYSFKRFCSCCRKSRVPFSSQLPIWTVHGWSCCIKDTPEAT